MFLFRILQKIRKAFSGNNNSYNFSAISFGVINAVFIAIFPAKEGLKFDKGLKKSKFGVVILSRSYISKYWTNYELEGLFQRESNGRRNGIFYFNLFG